MRTRVPNRAVNVGLGYWRYSGPTKNPNQVRQTTWYLCDSCKLLSQLPAESKTESIDKYALAKTFVSGKEQSTGRKRQFNLKFEPDRHCSEIVQIGAWS